MSERPANLLARTTPAWFDEAKLGIFIHWTPAAIPAFAPNGRTIFDMPDDPNGVKMWRRLPYAETYQTTLHVEGSLTQRFHAAHFGDRPFDDFGNLLINIGPTATGEIPWEQAQRLSDLGWWLQTDGDAVYGTRPWVRHAGLTSDGLDVRYTANDDAVNAIVLGTPMDLGRPAPPAVEVDLRLDEGATVSLVGRPGDLAWTSSPAGVRVELPEPPHPRPAMSLRFAPAAAVHPFDEV